MSFLLTLVDLKALQTSPASSADKIELNCSIRVNIKIPSAQYLQNMSWKQFRQVIYDLRAI